MQDVSSNDIINYCKQWRTSQDIREYFNLSNTQWFNRCNKLRGIFIKRIEGKHFNNSNNRTYIYKATEELNNDQMD